MINYHHLTPPRAIEEDVIDLGWSDLSYDEAVTEYELCELHDIFMLALKQRRLTWYQRLCLYICFGDSNVPRP